MGAQTGIRPRMHLLWGLVAIGSGMIVAVALWIVARRAVLSLAPDYILFPRHETAGQRLFVYAVFGVGSIVAGLLVRRWGWRWGPPAAAAAGGLAYFAVVFTIQNLFVNPDYFKLVDRGYLLRGVEVAGLGAVLGALVTVAGRLGDRPHRGERAHGTVSSDTAQRRVASPRRSWRAVVLRAP